MTTKRWWGLLLVGVLGCGGAHDDEPAAAHEHGSAGAPGVATAETIFVAVETDGELAALDASSGALIGKVSLMVDDTHYMAHNAQVDNEGATVWITAIPTGAHVTDESQPHDHGGAAGDKPDQLVGVDATTLAIKARIDLGLGVHAAHVVVSGKRAFVTTTAADGVLEVDLEGQKVARRFPLPAGTGPHGLRLSRDAKHLVIAGMTDGSLQLLDLASGAVERHDVPGRAVQAAVTDKAAFVSLYDTKQVARLDLATHQLTLFDMPAGSAGPVQLYPTADGASLWVADQGKLGTDPAGKWVVRIDATTGETTLKAEVDPAPHGVVLTPDGKHVWVTTVEKGTVQMVDAETGAVHATTAVGNGPNGISCRHGGGAMP